MLRRVWCGAVDNRDLIFFAGRVERIYRKVFTRQADGRITRDC